VTWSGTPRRTPSSGAHRPARAPTTPHASGAWRRDCQRRCTAGASARWRRPATPGAAAGDLPRVDQPSALMSGPGRPPAAAAAGGRRRPGAITPAGPTHARRARVEGARASRSPADVSRHLPRRRAAPPHTLQAISWTAHRRSGKRARRRPARGKPAQRGGVARARASGGGLWASAPQVAGAPAVPQPQAHCPAHAAGGPRGSEEAPPRCGATRDGVQRRVQETRAESQAGPRRAQGRWSPPHGAQQGQPSCLTGSGASDTTCAAPPPSLTLTGKQNRLRHAFEEDGMRVQHYC
jgi:hypothetical protein